MKKNLPPLVPVTDSPLCRRCPSTDVMAKCSSMYAAREPNLLNNEGRPTVVPNYCKFGEKCVQTV